MNQHDQRTKNRKKLQALLRDLFQFDHADLDFGIYRIMNHKRDEIERFIEHDLLQVVEQALARFQAGDRRELEAQMAQLRQQLGPAIGEDGAVKAEFRPVPIAQEYTKLRRQLLQMAVAEETEARIFNDLWRFFSRYYDQGDFLTERRYSSREAKYCVPYNGEEVMLHWANRDQYYVKTGERFTDYRFTAGEYTVWFRLHRADVPQDDVKGDKRYFVLHEEQPLTYDDETQTLIIPFAYRPLTEEEQARHLGVYNAQQSKSNRRKTLDRSVLCVALETEILEALDLAPALQAGAKPGLKAALAAVSRRREQTALGNSRSNLLGRHLNRYTARHTMDYFVHKDLGRFLRRELDVFLKTEVMRLDDLVADETGDMALHVLTRMRVVRQIAHRIIDFLAQIEDFQKRLFEKRKFVVQTDYCITLDRVPEVFYPEILANEAQLEQWRRLYNVDAWEENLFWQGTFDEVFLANHPYVMLDTAFFDQDFKARLLASFDDLDGAVDGVLIHGENFQALNLLLEKFRAQIRVIFIDPPYNTGSQDFLYKDNYRHSSWISMMDSRLLLAAHLMTQGGSLWLTVDDTEASHCRLLCEYHIPGLAFLSSVAWEKVYSPRMDAKQFSSSYDTVLVSAKLPDWKPNPLLVDPNLDQFPHIAEDGRRYRSDPLRKWGKNSLRQDRPNLWYPIAAPNGEDVWPIKPDGREGCWRWGKKRVEQHYDELDWLDKGHGIQPYLRQYADESNTRPPETLWPYEVAGSTHEAQEELKALFPGTAFTTPKPTRLILHIVRIGDAEDSTILDYFAGSGTTAHAVMDLNREDGGERKYILVEIGDYFDTVLKPRILKVAFSANWKDGVPQDRDGVSHMFKYHRIESYEDALNNICVRPPEAGQLELLRQFDDYMLHYMLDFETRDSPTLLAQEAFEKPFDYTLRIQQGHQSPEDTTVDLVETFHYLIGMHVRRLERYEHQARIYVVSRGHVRSTRGIEHVVTIWRDTAGLDLEQEADWVNRELLTDLVDRVYVNGYENFIHNAEPTEITFRKRMEDTAPP